MPYRARAAEILAAWRDVEQRYREAAEGTEESERLVAELVRLRAEYLEVVAQAAGAHAPEPPPFPDT